MEEENTYYDENNRKNPLIKILLIIIIIALLLIVAIIVIQNVNKKSNETILLNAGKKYFEDTSKLPTAVGECSTISLEYLENENKIANAKNFVSCDGKATYVKVCKLSSENYQYTPILSCNTTDDTVFGDYQVGTEKDLVADKSDVKFKYLPEYYTTDEKNFYPNNKTNEDEVNELYISAPSEEYKYKSAAVSNAAKYYKKVNDISYWNNGGYSSTTPDGYPNKGEEGTAVTKISLTSPATADYRTIKEVTLYRSRNATKPNIAGFICYSNTITGTVTSNVPCKDRTDGFTSFSKALYTCDGKNYVESTDSCPSTDWSEWSTTKCTNSATIECESKNGYEYTDKTWKWYTNNEHNSYYPSGSASASGEKTYYVSAPAEGYIKDATTVTTAYRYYKLVDSIKSTSGEWIKLSDDYLELDEMLELVKNYNENVKSLSDIENDDNLRYSIQLEYANRK